MNELWVARDRGSGAVYIYHEEPKDNGTIFYTPNRPIFEVEADVFPDLKRGECKRLVMAEESSE